MSDNVFGLPDDENTLAAGDDPFADSPVVEDTEPEQEIEAEEVEIETEAPVTVESGTPPTLLPPASEREVEPGDAAKTGEGVEVEGDAEAGEGDPAVDWQKRFNDTRELQTRTARELQEQRQAYSEAQALLAQAAQVIQQERSQRTQVPAQPSQEQLQQRAREIAFRAEQLGIDPEVLVEAERVAEQRAQATVAQQMAPFQEQQAQQQQAAYQQAEQRRQYEAAVAASASAIDTWKAMNPVDDATEGRMAQVIEALELDMTDLAMYDVAHEAANSPALAQVLRGIPDLVTTEDGMQTARQLAAALGNGEQPSQPTRTRNTPAARQRAHVETGGTGAAPAAQERPKDAWDRVLDLTREERSTDSSILGV